jgi:hypothetical protein
MVGYEQLACALGKTSNGRPEAGEIEPGSNVSKAEALTLLSDVLTTLEQTQLDPEIFASADDRMTSLVQSFLARSTAQKPEWTGNPDRGPEAKFDSRDLMGWAGSLFDWIKGLKKRDFIDQDVVPQPMPAKARIAVLSDWGTGMYGGPDCAKSIQKDGNFDLLLHLGDVYYSGDIDEVEERFLKFWPKVPRAISRALNSNHEMYSGGFGYFDRILPAFRQQASYFAFQNDYWLLVGLDTGYSEHQLHGGQADWLLNLVRNAGDRRIILFSHHQPYSLYEKQGHKLVGQLGPLLEQRKIHSWYWGHEHRCVVYDPHPLWGLRGRCVGHSAFPYFRDHFEHALDAPGWQSVLGKNLVPGARVLDGPNEYVEGKQSKYGPNGYVVLEFDDRDLRERYINPNGTELPSPAMD